MILNCQNISVIVRCVIVKAIIGDVASRVDVKVVIVRVVIVRVVVVSTSCRQDQNESTPNQTRTKSNQHRAKINSKTNIREPDGTFFLMW